METKEQALKLTENFYFTYVFYLDHIISRIELKQELSSDELESIEGLYHLFLPIIKSGLVRDEFLYIELFKRIAKIMIHLHGKDEFFKECFGESNPLLGVIHKFELYLEYHYIPDFKESELKTARALLNDQILNLSSLNIDDDSVELYHDLLFFLESALKQEFKLNYS